jgi:hypothetical protein
VDEAEGPYASSDGPDCASVKVTSSATASVTVRAYAARDQRAAGPRSSRTSVQKSESGCTR